MIFKVPRSKVSSGKIIRIYANMHAGTHRIAHECFDQFLPPFFRWSQLFFWVEVHPYKKTWHCVPN